MPRPRKSVESAAAPRRSRYHVEALARGLGILAAFAPLRPRLTVKDLSTATGLLPSTVFRVVMTLVDLGYLEAVGKGTQYRLSARAVLLGYSALAGLTLEELATPALQRLHRDTGESVFLSLLAGDHAIDVVSLRRPGLLSTLGQMFPLYCTPGGKIWLAFLPEKQRLAILDRIEFVPRAPRTVTSRKNIEQEIARVRRDGFATVDEELTPGVCGAAAPVLDRDGRCIAAVAVSAPISRVPLDQMVRDVVPRIVRAAGEIAERLRWRDVSAPTNSDPEA